MRPTLLALAALAACAAAAPAPAQDYPKLKSGQWEMTTTTSKTGAAGTPSKTTMCTDEAIQKEMTTMGAGMSKEMCAKNEIKRDGAKFIGNSECKIGDSKVVSQTVMTLAGDTSYKTEIRSTYDPPFMGMKESQTALEGKYVGPCRDGLVPGDVVMPGGQKVNIKGIGSGKGPLPSAQPPRTTKVTP